MSDSRGRLLKTIFSQVKIVAVCRFNWWLLCTYILFFERNVTHQVYLLLILINNKYNHKKHQFRYSDILCFLFYNIQVKFVAYLLSNASIYNNKSDDNSGLKFWFSLQNGCYWRYFLPYLQIPLWEKQIFYLDLKKMSSFLTPNQLLELNLPLKLFQWSKLV